MASRMHTYPITDIIKAPYLMENFDSTLIKKYLNQLGKDNVNVFLSS